MDYRETLNLPQTKFKMKANLTQREPMVLKRWEKENLYQQLQQAAAERPLFILHDGPPYANGNIHLGTAFNKVLKDIILRSNLTTHLDVVVPGQGGLDYGVYLKELSKLAPDIPLMMEHMAKPEEYRAAAAHIRKVAAGKGLGAL